MELINGDCLQELKKIKDKSIDFVYLDLPYGQTACAWDVKLDLTALWVELKRIAKNDRTPFFFSCTTKFGFELFNNSPKGYFRWDLVWEKNRAAGFLNAYKLPMRKHEMVYCFAKKTPEYDVSSHKEYTEENKRKEGGKNAFECYGKTDVHKNRDYPSRTHKNPLPTSVLPPQEDHELVYCFAKKTPEYDVSSHKEYTTDKLTINNQTDIYGEVPNVSRKRHKDPLPTSIIPPSDDHELVYCFAKKTPEYDVSSHKEYVEDNRPNRIQNDIYGKVPNVNRKQHKDPLPTSILPPQEDHELVYCFAKKTPVYDVSSHKEYYEQGECFKTTKVYDKTKENGKKIKPKVHKTPLPTSVLPPSDDHELVYCFAKKTPEYDVSSHKEYTEHTQNRNKPKCQLYGEDMTKTHKLYKEPLPTSVLPPSDDHELVYCFAKKTPEYDVSSHKEYTIETGREGQFVKSDVYGKQGHEEFKSKTHKDRLPTSVLPEQDIPSSWCKYKLDSGINHRTAKPVKLMEFLLKYWTKEGATVLDPTAGSGSMGIACKNMNRKFIGIEKDPDIFKIMSDRIENHTVKPTIV